MTSVAGRILEALHAAGSSTVFGLPGVHNLPFWEIGRGPEVPLILKVRHEQTAVYAADSWARASGRLGGALVTTGPGAANCLAAFGEAAMVRSPIVLVASEVSSATRALSLTRALHQSADQAAMFRPLAKSVWTPRSVAEVQTSIGEAIVNALSPPCGPVYIDVPSDLLSERCRPIEWPAAPAPRCDASLVESTVRIIDGSQSVGIWAGGGAIAAGAADAVAALAERLHAPVFSTFSSRGILPRRHPCAVTLPPHEPEIESLMASLDLLIAIGTDFDGMLTKNASLHLPRVVDVNILAGQRWFGYSDVIPVPGDALEITRLLAAKVRSRDAGPADGLGARLDDVWTRLRADRRTEEAAEFVEVVARVSRDAIVVNDMTVPSYWLCSYLTPPHPRRLQYPVGWGTLGYALPASVGAGALREHPVLAVCGDAGVLFAVGELATLKENGLPVTLLIVDDGGYGMLKFDPGGLGRFSDSMDLESPDFVAMCASFGLASRFVEGITDLEASLRSGIESGKPNAVVWRGSLYPPRSTSPRWNEGE